MKYEIPQGIIKFAPWAGSFCELLFGNINSNNFITPSMGKSEQITKVMHGNNSQVQAAKVKLPSWSFINHAINLLYFLESATQQGDSNHIVKDNKGTKKFTNKTLEEINFKGVWQQTQPKRKQ